MAPFAPALVEGFVGARRSTLRRPLLPVCPDLSRRLLVRLLYYFRSCSHRDLSPIGTLFVQLV